MEYNDKHAITIEKFVDTTCLTRYPRQIETTYNQGSEFISNEFRKLPIENNTRY